MTRETAVYWKLLLQIGLSAVYFDRLEQMLTEEPELNGALLELSFCGKDVNKAISLLIEYTYYEHIDYDIVFSLIIEDLKDQYFNKRMLLADTINAMHVLVTNSGLENVQPWRTMERLHFDYDDGLEEMYPNEWIDERLIAFLVNRELMG